LRSSFLAAALAGIALHAQDTTREITLTLTEGTSIAAAVSPDRRWIAIDLVGSIWVLPFGGGEATRITPDLLEARQPTWSPDANAIGFQGYDDGVWHIYVVPREGGEPRKLTSGEFDDREPAWSHDGKRIAFSSDRVDGITTIWEVAVANGEVQRRSTRDGWMPAWTPTDREITFVSQDNGRNSPRDLHDRVPGLYAVSDSGRERLVLDGREHVMPAAAAVSPDGTELAYTTGTGALVIAGQVQHGEDVFPFRPHWISPFEIVYTADGHIKRRSVTGQTAVVPFTAKLSLRRTTYTIAHVPLHTSEPQRVAGIVTPTVSPDGAAIAFVALGDVWVRPREGTPTRITDDPAVELDPAWSPDGEELAFASDRRGNMDVWIHNFRTNVDHQVTHEEGRVSGIAWSPDGSRLAYLVDRRELVVKRLRQGRCVGVDERVRPPGGSEIGRPTWAADCHVIAIGALLPYSDRYREGLNQILVYSFDTHSFSSSILFAGHSAGNREDNGPVWAPNGNQMAFVSEGRLLTVNVDSDGGALGPPMSVAQDAPEAPSWEGDSRHIVYATPDGLRRVLADGSAPEPIPIDLRWKSDRPPPRVVVHAGHLFDGVIEGLRGESDIIIDGGVIRSIGGHDPQLHVGTVVDASNETVIPGLVEMHAHLDRTYGQDFGRVWLAYGITSVRIPAINPYEGLELRESFDSGRRPGPRVFIAGDPFDGIRIYYPGGVSITSDGQLDDELARARRLGIDFFKTYVRLPDRFQKRIIEYAHNLGRPVTSHELFPAAALGIDGVEHLRGTSRRGYSPKLSAQNIAYRDVVDTIVKAGVTLTPTIVIHGAFAARETGDKLLLSDPRLALFPKPLVLRLAELASMAPDARLDVAVKPLDAIVKAIAGAGGTILAGTDSPINPYGLSLHVELEEYVHAGLTTFQALQTATVNAARALGLENELGTIETGKRADLTFLGGDPLTDIRNTRDVRRVMRGGRIYTLAELVRH
jgi:Tol biopolymer transport system component